MTYKVFSGMLNPAQSVHQFVLILCCSIFMLLVSICFCCVRFSFFSTSQEIGWEERLRNDLFLSSST